MEWSVETGFMLTVGLLMIGLWGGLVATGSVPELDSAPVEIGLHLVAEMVTALGLILAGLGRLAGRRWAIRLTPVALGMLLYTVINSSGFYAARDESVAVVGFAALAVVTGLLVSRHVAAASDAAGLDPARR